MTPPPPRRRPRLPTPSLSRTDRIHKLIEWLRFGRPLTAPLAADTFGVSRRTITRDLNYLRDTLRLDVSFDPAQNSFVLSEQHTALPFLAFPSLAPVLLDARPYDPSEESPHPTVAVRFSAQAVQAYIARGGHQVPPEARNPDGTLEVRFTPTNTDEFLCYVLSRGHHLEVLSPPDFRDRVRMEIHRMLSRYCDEVPPGA